LSKGEESYREANNGCLIAGGAGAGARVRDIVWNCNYNCISWIVIISYIEGINLSWIARLIADLTIELMVFN
jgi:hypothetical protein